MLTANEISILNALIEEETDRTYLEKDNNYFDIVNRYRKTLSVILDKLHTMDQVSDFEINEDASINFVKFSKI